jgi:DNA repair photolyase
MSYRRLLGGRQDSGGRRDPNPFDLAYAIVDPTMPERVAYDAQTTRPEDRGVVQLCTTTDAWAREAQEHNLGRRCLQAILSQPGWSVRILTKDAAAALR